MTIIIKLLKRNIKYLYKLLEYIYIHNLKLSVILMFDFLHFQLWKTKIKIEREKKNKQIKHD